MPVISYFFGIYVRMYHDDHNPPHFNIEYQGFEAYVSIDSGEVIEGKLPKKAEKLVKEWTLENREELLLNWQKAINFEPLNKIKGADND